MEYLWVITLLAAIQFVVFGMFVGAARAKGGVQAPAISGDPMFERRFRVHYNTLEQLVIFYPGLWAFGMFISTNIAGLLGLIYLIGRVVYFIQYSNRPESRGPGFALSALPCYALLLGGLVGAIMQLSGS
jgi:glutathione S-transferase